MDVIGRLANDKPDVLSVLHCLELDLLSQIQMQMQ